MKDGQLSESPDNSTSANAKSTESRQAPHHAPDKPRVRALALRATGHSYPDIAQQVGVSHSTVQRWVQRAELDGETKPLLERHHRNGIQALDLIRDGMDVIEEDESGGLALKNLQTLNIIAGTSTDKLQKESAPPAQQNTQVIIVLGSEKPVIEGEAREVP